MFNLFAVLFTSNLT